MDSERKVVMDSARKYVRLLSMRDAGGAALFERLQLAKELLADRAWVDDPAAGGGDENKAIDRLETECFGDVGLDLPGLLDILRACPRESTWRANKYNIRRMFAEMKAREALATGKVKEIKPVADAIETPEARRIKRLEETVSEKVSDLAVLREENRSLRERVKTLETENKRLRDSIDRIEKISAAYREAAS